MLKINGIQYTAAQEPDGAPYYYRKDRRRVIFMDAQKEPFAALVRNRDGAHLVNCAEIDGRLRYQFGLSDHHADTLGIPHGYMDGRNAIDAMAGELLKVESV